MIQINKITSNFILDQNTFHWIAGAFMGLDFSLSFLIPENIRPITNVIIPIIYLILFIFNLFYLFYISYGWSYTLRDKEELTSKSNNGNFAIVIIIFVIVRYFSYESTILGEVLYILFDIFFIVFFFKILLWQFLKKIVGIPSLSLTVGCILGICFLFYLGKTSYSWNYGDEIIGSYFEKSTYRTQYYVNVFRDDKSCTNYRLPADIYVFEERVENGSGTDDFGNERIEVKRIKRIILEKVYWSNGGYLDFKDCLIEDREPGIGGKNLCTDNHGRKWYIELTDQKVN